MFENKTGEIQVQWYIKYYFLLSLFFRSPYMSHEKYVPYFHPPFEILTNIKNFERKTYFSFQPPLKISTNIKKIERKTYFCFQPSLKNIDKNF